MQNVEIFKFELSPELFEKIPLNERAFFIALGHISNELNILSKLTLINTKTKPQGEITESAFATQWIFFIKLSALKIYEGYKLLKNKRVQSILRKYSDDPAFNFLDFQKELDAYFSKDSLIKFVRNKLVGHYDGREIAKASKRKLNTKHCFYIEKTRANSLYFASEEVMFSRIMSKAKEGEDYQELMDRLFDETVKMSGLLMGCTQSIMIQIAKRYAKTEWNIADLESEQIPVSNLNDLSLPFFIDLEK